MSFHMIRLIIEVCFSLYFFVRCRAVLGWTWWLLPLGLWLIIMVIPRADFMPSWLDALFTIQPTWIGCLILFMMASLGLDFVRLLIGLAGLASGHSWWQLLSVKRALPAALVITFGIAGYSYYMAHSPSLKHLVIETEKLPEDVDSLRVVQLSDVHLGRLIGLGDFEKVIALAKSAKPDMVVVTGDLVDDDLTERDADAALLASLKPRYGTYAVLGNHEYHSGLENSLRFIEKSGLKLLRGEGVEAGGIVVAGVDDESHRASVSLEPTRLLRQWQDSGLFVLLLKHRPRPVPDTAELYDLQLSGHTHGGQMWPGHILIGQANGHYLSGLYENAETESAVYVSRGSGFWGMPLRFLAPPEVTLIELLRKTSDK